MVRFKDDPVAWRREYFREYIKKNREKHNAHQRQYMRNRTNPEKARRIEDAKAYYRAEFPPIDGVIMNDSRNRFEIYYSRGEKRFMTECYFEASEDCKIHYMAICDLMKEDRDGTDYGS